MSETYAGRPAPEPIRRKTDGWFGWLTRLWDWVDARDVDKHIVSIVIIFGTFKITQWAMDYAEIYAEKPGLEVAAIIAAVLAPYMALQAAAIKFYFEARQT